MYVLFTRGQHKNKLWSEVESVVDSHSPNQIMYSLLITARESAYNLKDKTSNIDIKKDAEKLRYSSVCLCVCLPAHVCVCVQTPTLNVLFIV